MPIIIGTARTDGPVIDLGNGRVMGDLIKAAIP
jgi:hypothetical protein